MQPDIPTYARLLEHQSRCQQIAKQAYNQCILEKTARFSLGVNPTTEFQPRRALLGALAGAGTGALPAAMMDSPYGQAAAIGIPALLGAGLGGFTTLSDDDLRMRLAANQLSRERQEMLSQYGAQLANSSDV